MIKTLIQSYPGNCAELLNDVLDSFQQEFNELQELLPEGNAAIRDKSNSLISMLQNHSDEMKALNSCLMAQRVELEHQEQLLTAVNCMAGKLIGGDDWRQNLHIILSLLGKAVRVDRTYIFQDYTDPSENLCTRKIEEWSTESIAIQQSHSLMGAASYKEAGFKRWVKMLKEDKPIFGDINTFPVREQGALKKQHISSLLLMPIRVKNSNWGFIGFDNCRKQKEWKSVELDVLRTAANMLGDAICQRRVKDELQEREQTYRLIMDASRDGCCIVDDQLRTIEVNAALATMLKREKGEVAKSSLRDFIHPDSQQEAERFLSGKALPGEEIDIRLIGAQHILPATLHVSKLENSNQEKSKTFLFLRDQSSYHQMTEMNTALVESNERLHCITNLAQDAIILLDRNGQIYFWNPAATHIFGYSADEVIGKDLHNIFYSDEQYLSFQKRLHPFFSPSTTRGSSLNRQEFEFHHKNGTSVWVEISFSASTHSEQPIIVGVCRDITVRRKAQLALKESEQKYVSQVDKFSTVLDAIPDGLMVFNSARRVTWTNKAARSLFNLENNLKLSKCPYSCPASKPQNDQNCIVEDTFKRGEEQRSQIVINNDKTYDRRSYPIYDCEGNINSVVVAMRDITQRLQLEAKAVRTAHLTSLGLMAAGVAHEINNPNNFIMLNSPLISEACQDATPILDSFYQEHGEFYLGGLSYSEFKEKGPLLHRGILEGSQRIARIVNHLKEFASQDKQGSFVPMQVNDLVERGVQLIGNQIRKYTSALQIDLARQLPSVQGNPGQIEQVIINLLLNAAESLPESTAAIVLSTSLDSEEKMVLIQVRDEGCGIAPEEIKKVTQPFYTSKLKSGGTGLGLSVSQSLLAQHGGILEIQSQLGEGTTVTVGLPIN